MEEWEDQGMCDGVYYVHTHKPCGTQIMVLMGQMAVCPKCEPQRWAELRARDGKFSGA